MKKVAIFLIAIVLISGILGCSDGLHSNDYPDIPGDAVLAVDQPIGSIDVKYWERVVDGVFHVINDYVLLHLDPDTDEIIKCEQQWRDIDVDLAHLEVESFEPPGGEHFWKRVVVFLEEEDLGYFYTVSNATQCPLVCWEVRYSDGTTAMYDLSGNETGCGIGAPHYSFLLSGYHNSASPDEWRRFRENASDWFQEWSDLTFSWSLPLPTIISEYVSDPGIQLYYAIAHGSSSRFQADSAGSYYRASATEVDMEDRDPMLFAFIGHCEGMTQTGSGSFSYAFRKGSMTNTVTVGYSGMGSSPGWPDALDWQDCMFEGMDEGRTIRDAFDLACAQYPRIASNVVFVGDPNLKLPTVEDSVVTFPDSDLEAAIREAIGKPTGDIYPSDLAGLTSLDASKRNIADLTGLEQCTSLIMLNLNTNQISEITPLANLTNLTTLWLGGNQISDIQALVNLTNLTHLYLHCNQISDSNLPALTNLTNLTCLELSDNQISDITPLANLTNLTDLFLHNNQISDISPLANLTSLTVLWLAYNQINYVTPLANLTNLIYLDLWVNQISDITSLANLTNLTYLILGNNQINDISPLVDNLGLRDGDELWLFDNPLSEDSINIYIPELEARGVIVLY